MQQLNIIGNIGRDAEIKSGNGSDFVTFSVAVNKRYTRNGQPVEETNWISCVTKQTSLAQYLKSGTQVFCQGEMSVSQYQNQQREWKVDIRLNCQAIQLLGSKKDGEQTTPARSTQPAALRPAPAPVRQQTPATSGSEPEEESLPF